MKAAVLFRVASVLIVLFAVGHTVGFRQIDPNWGIGSLIESLKTRSFETQGVTRTYWDFYVGFGLFCTVFLLLAALVAWNLSGLSPVAMSETRWLGWGLLITFGLVFLLSWRYFFLAPMIFSAVIFACLLAGTLLSRVTNR